MIPAWQVRTWNPVVLTHAEFTAAIGAFNHVSTNVADSGRGHDRRRSGQALWATTVARPEAPDESAIIGIAFDWAEVREGVLALVDPMRLVTNIQLVDDQGRYCDEASTAVHLNTAVYRMPWQRAVCSGQ